ncbi:MAG: alpha-2-macroglobulin domain protein, partial [Verrucomicrobiaceae bacterium]|nr:alpha-2-macroglobulin domain protein [Verrucomicrobiaceae bacterium]
MVLQNVLWMSLCSAKLNGLNWPINMSRWLSFLQPRFWGKVGRAVLGDVRYTPPVWPGGVYDSMCRSPGLWAATIVTAGVAIGGGLKYHDWTEAHKPHPRQTVEAREVTGKIADPGVSPVVDGKSVPLPVVLSFSEAAAKLDLVKKDNPPGISLSPAHPGHWRWATDKKLEFKPDIDWPAGTQFTVSLDAAQTPPEVKLKESRWSFTTPELLPQWSNVEFYTNPQDPEVHQVTAELNFTHPVKLEQVQNLIRMEVLGKSPLFDWGGKASASLFTVKEGKAQRQFFLSSARIVIPAKEDFVKLMIAPGAQSLTGGKASATNVEAKVRVPDMDSGFAIEQVTSEIIRTGEGEPEQFIFVDTTGYAKPEEIASHVQAWVLPKRKDREWQGPNEATEAVLKRSQVVKLKPVETAADEKAPMSTRHGFKFVSEKPGQMFVQVTAGAKALGGFRLAKPAATILPVPEFPKEVQIQGKGGLLAINGERKVSIKSRGVKHLRITLARVPSAQLNHLVRFTQGDFQAPEFNNYVDEENIAHFHREIIPVAAKNDYEAAYSTFDFSAAVRAADVADQDASRGLFFVFVEGVKPRGDEDSSEDDNTATDPDAIMSKWVSVDGRHYHSGEEQDSGAYSHRFILVTDLGLLVKRSSDGSRDLFVQSVSKGEPVAGAMIGTLAKNGEFINQSVTDAEGHVHLANVEDLQREKQAVAFTARVGNDLAFIPFHKPDRLLDFSRFDTGGIEASSKDQLDAFVFTERGVYRPGDTVHVAAMVKRRDWQGNQEDLPLAFELYDAKEQLVDHVELPVSRDGYIEWNTRTAETDPTGQYEVRLSVIRGPDSRERIGRTALRVEDFQPDR